MTYNFDEIIDRRHTNSVKWEFFFKENGPVFLERGDDPLMDDQLLPLWVADMDFRAAPAIVDAMVKRAQHGIYGYTSLTESYFETVMAWMEQRKHWEIEKDWIKPTAGIVPAIFNLVQTFTEPSDKVLVQPPVYHPFFNAIEKNGREICRNPLINENGVYRMDFADLAQKAADPAVKMAILCHPHNPVGRVWTREELTNFGNICLENDVLVISDEIHSDLIFSWANFTPFAAISDDFAQHSVTNTAGSKSFNLAGVHLSNNIIPNAGIRKKFQVTLTKNGLYGVSPFALTALQAGYRYGDKWLDAAMAYIEQNYLFLKNFLVERLPQITITQPEGTYLMWLDARQLGLDHEALEKLVLEKGRLYLNQGVVFGAEGEGFLRMNIACPRAILKNGLERLNRAVKMKG